MKYFDLFLILLVLLSGCLTVVLPLFCSIQIADTPTRTEIPGKDFTWHKTELKIAIDPILASDTIMILDAANSWSEYCGVNFVLAEDIYDSDVIVFYNCYLSYEVYAITINNFNKDKSICKSNINLSSISLFLASEEIRESTYRHEFGHVLGLDHSDIRSDLMYESQNEEQSGDLTDNDKLRIRTLYGKEN